MKENDLLYFSLLKTEVAKAFNLSYPGNNKKIEDWKGQEIVNFQEELLVKVKGQISEKWFYTHIKSESQDKLPRIDVLNLLSKYAGYIDWNDFKSKNPLPESNKTEIANSQYKISNKTIRRSVRFYISLLGLLLLISIGLFFILRDKNHIDIYKYRFCFVDSDNQHLLSDVKIDITLFNKNESPMRKECVNGCFDITTSANSIKFAVNAPYYRSDTITRNLDKSSGEEKIMLKTDDYALMLHYFSKTKISDWKIRRQQLEAKIADDAMIFQVYDANEKGMEIFNKEEFINKLTMPLQSLKNIDVIEMTYSKNKIQSIRFRQIEN